MQAWCKFAALTCQADRQPFANILYCLGKNNKWVLSRRHCRYGSYQVRLDNLVRGLLWCHFFFGTDSAVKEWKRDWHGRTRICVRYNADFSIKIFSIPHRYHILIFCTDMQTDKLKLLTLSTNVATCLLFIWKMLCTTSTFGCMTEKFANVPPYVSPIIHAESTSQFYAKQILVMLVNHAIRNLAPFN